MADFDRVAVEVDDLLLGDLAHLLLRHLADEAAARRLGAGGGLLADLQVGGLLQPEGHRRLTHLEGERAVLIGGDDHRNRRALLHLRGARVEGLAEFHDVEAALAERGTDRGRRIGRARRHLQFYVADDFLRHDAAPNAARPSRLKLRKAAPGCRFVVRTGTPTGGAGVLPRLRGGLLAGLPAGGNCGIVRRRWWARSIARCETGVLSDTLWPASAALSRARLQVGAEECAR